MAEDSGTWSMRMAYRLMQAGGPCCELCGARPAHRSGRKGWTPWLCGAPECEALADQVSTLGDLGRLHRG